MAGGINIIIKNFKPAIAKILEKNHFMPKEAAELAADDIGEALQDYLNKMYKELKRRFG